MKSIFKNIFAGFALLAIAEGFSRIFVPAAASQGTVSAWTIHNTVDLGAAGPVVPLAGLANRPTRLCEENEGAVEYFSDQFGFHNEATTWSKTPDIALIGDSFVHGHCVSQKHQLSSLLEERGNQVLNLGLRGSGPLSQLGVMLEYALPQKPKKILWFILANDFLYDLERELAVPALTAYSDGKVQGLASRQAEIEMELLSLGAEKVSIAPRGLALPSLLTSAIFGLLRPEPSRALEEGNPKDFQADRLKVFAEILVRGKELAGETPVEFIFIPDSWIFTQSTGPQVRALVAELKKLLAEKGMELRDPTNALEAGGLAHYSALDGYYGHFNPGGFKILADFVAEKF